MKPTGLGTGNWKLGILALGHSGHRTTAFHLLSFTFSFHTWHVNKGNGPRSRSRSLVLGTWSLLGPQLGDASPARRYLLHCNVSARSCLALSTPAPCPLVDHNFSCLSNMLEKYFKLWLLKIEQTTFSSFSRDLLFVVLRGCHSLTLYRKIKKRTPTRTLKFSICVPLFFFLEVCRSVCRGIVFISFIYLVFKAQVAPPHL